MALTWENRTSAAPAVAPVQSRSGEDASSEDLLDYWRAIEMVQAPDLPYSVIPDVFQGDASTYPWLRQQHSPKAPFGPRYALFGGCFGNKDALDSLSRNQSVVSEASERRRKTFSLYRVTLDSQAGYEAGSFRLSTVGYVLNRLAHSGKPGDGFEELDHVLRSYADQVLVGPLCSFGERLGELTDHIADYLDMRQLISARSVRHRCVVLGAASSPDFDHFPINSLSLTDIERVRTIIGTGSQSAVVDGYLQRERHVGRLDIESEEGRVLAAKAMTPASGSPATWPSSDALSKSERLASNLIFGELRGPGGIQAVSLPSGASPHRLIREIVADALIGRADILASFPRTTFAFRNGDAASIRPGRGQVWALAPELREFSVVVASSDQSRLDTLGEQLMLPRLGDDRCNLVDQILRNGFFAPDTGSQEWTSGFSASNSNCDIAGALRASREHPLYDMEKNSTWRQAITTYDLAKQRVLSLRASTEEISTHCREIGQLRAKLNRLQRSLALSERTFSEMSGQLAALEQSEQDAHQLEPDRPASRAVCRFVPVKIAAACAKVWRRNLRVDSSERGEARQELGRIIERLKTQHALETIGIEMLKAELAGAGNQLRVEVGKLLPFVEAHSLSFLDDWLHERNPHAADGELVEPWVHAELNRAQAELFEQSMRLHAVFVRLESSKLLDNLEVAVGLSQGNIRAGLDDEALCSAWEAMFFLCPVLRVNAGTLSRALQTVGQQQIGWMIMCDAGRMPPQAALGAVYRAKRYVSIGGMDDLVPSLAAPKIFYRMIAAGMARDIRWHRRGMTAQRAAEEASPFGYVCVSDLGNDWVGLPIRSVEAGNEPMLSILSRVSGSSRLVARSDAGGGVDAFDSGWIDIRGPVSGGWVEAELAAAGRLLDILADRGVPAGTIALSSPYARVRQELARRFGKAGYQLQAHEHMSGQQCGYVVLVLGGADPRSRERVAQSAGVIAAAAGGATRGLFVIGDLKDWGRRPAMRAAAELLPVVSVDVCAAAVEA